MIAELESRLAEIDRLAEALGRLRDFVISSRAGFDSLSFEERRPALRAVGFKMYANGEETAGWRYEVRLGAEPERTAAA